ncbi:hypothetical protein [Pelodictyon luteolum]|nr:hypothetical protein [Pelodictyon luteolum]
MRPYGSLFRQYMLLRKEALADIPLLSSPGELLEAERPRFSRVGEECRPLTGLFHSYLLRGGFPQTALLESTPMAQKLLREDIVDKVLKRDICSMFGVRRLKELEQTFLYFCQHDGGMLDIPTRCNNLDVNKKTVLNFMMLLESAHLIYRLKPPGYGKEILRGRERKACWKTPQRLAGLLKQHFSNTSSNATTKRAAHFRTGETLPPSMRLIPYCFSL